MRLVSLKVLALFAIRQSSAWVLLPRFVVNVNGSARDVTRTFARSTTLTRLSQPQRSKLQLSAIPKDTVQSSSELGKIVASLALCASLLVLNTIGSAPATAYEGNDYASETVQSAIKAIKEASNLDATVKAYESVADIIIEGKGVGGQINYQGIALDRGYVADEDTTIYNPGLTLLTESEKDRLVEAVVQSKRVATSWNGDAQAGYEFLKVRLDPLHMYELRGYLKIVPFYGAAVYLGTLAVQQLARDLFPVAYFLGVAAIVVPVVVLVALGPQ